MHIPLTDYAREYDYEFKKRIKLPALPVEQRLFSQSTQVELSMSDSQACYEASRCLNCSINTIFDGEKCILCGGCVDICPSACLKIVNIEQLELNGQASSLPDHFSKDDELSAILKDDATCIRCGLCAARCPASAITMEEYFLKELCS